MTEAVTAHEITITRVIHAPRELVWRAWTDPEHLSRWWGARGWSTAPSDVTIEVRPGGIFRVGSVSDADGSEMTTEGVFREVVAPERLVLDEAAEDSWHEGARNVVTLADLGDGRTEMVMRSTIYTTDDAARTAEAGMRSAIDRLAEVVA